MKRTLGTGLLMLQLLVLSAPATTNAAAPSLLPIQGYLTDDADMPLNGVYKVSFTLLDAETAGMSLFSSTEPVTVTKGRFTVYIGDRQQLQLDKLHHSNAVWLEVTIVQSCGKDATCAAPTAINKTLIPRLQFATAAFAASAAFCSSADNAQALGGMTVAELQPKIADIACGPNKFVSGIQSGVPMCTSAQMASASTGSAPAQSSLPDVGCPSGQLLSGIQGGQAVCVPRPMDGRNGTDGKSGAPGASFSRCTWHEKLDCPSGTEPCTFTCPANTYAASGGCDLTAGGTLDENRPAPSGGFPSAAPSFPFSFMDSWTCRSTVGDVQVLYALCCPNN